MPENEESQSLQSAILQATRTPDPSLSHYQNFGIPLSLRRSLSVPSQRSALPQFEFVMGTIRQTIRRVSVPGIEQSWSADFSSVACSALRVSLLPAFKPQRTSGLCLRIVVERKIYPHVVSYRQFIASLIRGRSDATQCRRERSRAVSPVLCCLGGGKK